MFFDTANFRIFRIDEKILEPVSVAFLILLHFAFACSSLIRESPTFDESVHLAGGTAFWKLNDYRINPENGNFPQRWAALPLLADENLKFPAFNTNPFHDSSEYLAAFDFFYKLGNNPDSIIIRGRIIMLFLSVALGLSVYFWSKSIFGRKGALISLFLYAFSPTVLAHSKLVASDIAVSFAFISSVWTVWVMLQRITLPRILLSSLSLSFLFLSKMSALIILPVYLIMIVLRLKIRTPLEAALFRRTLTLRSQNSQFSAFLLCGIINFTAVFFFIWASFGFRYSMLNKEEGKRQIIDKNWQELLKEPGIGGKVVGFARSKKLLPEAYLFGFQFVMEKSKYRYAYLNGDIRLTGWWYYFPYACLVKTPLPTMGIILIACFALFAGFAKRTKNAGAEVAISGRKNLYYQTVPLVVFAAVYMIFAMSSTMNIGHRHVLPVYPAVFIIAGAASLSARKIIKYFAVPFFLMWLAFESLSIHPHYLAYFNQFAGGPENGHKHLVDSSLDWGQDLKNLKKWLNKNNAENQTVYVSYFGTASLDYYVSGARKLPCYCGQEDDFPFELKEGIYCVSATMLPLIYLPELMDLKDLNSGLLDEDLYKILEDEMEKLFEVENDKVKYQKLVNEKGMNYLVERYRLYHLLRFAKLARYLEKRKPDANAGFSIMIYKLSNQEIRQALSEKL